MIPYSLNIVPESSKKKIEFNHKLVFSGSCFSEHISGRLQDLSFNVFPQPNGIVFNPISIADAFERVLGKGDYTEKDLVQNNGYCHSKFHHSAFSEIHASETLKRINGNLHALKRYITNADFLFITFGSAYAYVHKADNTLYANCHKIPQTQFEKKLLTAEEIIGHWKGLIQELNTAYPKLQIVFSISPVRHLRDGVHENNLSKSVLQLAVHNLQNTFQELHYFPAYELVIDDLRDYRFFENDTAHPNAMAIEYVYSKFKETFFGQDCIRFESEMQEFNKMRSHQFRKEDGEEYLHFMRLMEKKREDLNLRYSIEL